MSLFEEIISNAAKNATKNATMRTVGAVATEALRAVGDVTVNVMAESKKNRPVRVPRAQKNDYIKAPDLDDFIGEHYLKAHSALQACGFTNISLVAQKDLRKGWLTKDGEVEEVSINGATDIRKRAKFLPSSPVVIVYHTFKDGYGSQSLSAPNHFKEPTQTSPLPVNSESDAVKNIYCGSCGKKQNAENQFCIACGKVLEK